MERPKSGARFRLAAGVQVTPVEELPPEVRDRLDRQGGRFALVRPGARMGALLVDEEIAALVEEFRQPSTFAESLIRFSRMRQRDPQEVLKESFPILQLLVERRFLVDAGSALVRGSGRQVLDSGDQFDDLVILRPLQRMEDTEVFQVRLANGRFGALKIGRRGSSAAADRLTRTRDILRRLAGDPGPELLGGGEHEGQDYLVLEWRAGSDAMVVTEEWRRRRGTEARSRLLEICCRILETYGDLHRRGVVHGDVNARNILVYRQDNVTVLDFEHAVLEEPASGGGPPPGRAGVPIYFEPEYARAVLDYETPPPASAAGEQYALAALVYELIAGVPYLDFDLRWEKLLEQIVEEPPRAFADRGLPPWPAVEEILTRALSKEPARRFPSVAAMSAALAAAEPSEPSRRLSSPSRGVDLEQLIGLTAEKAGQGGPWMGGDGTSQTRMSVYRGAAGVALALYRISRQLDDGTLLELGDAWIRRTTGEFDQTDCVEEPVEASAFVGPAGVHLVEAMIAAALEQSERRARALVKSLHSVNTAAPRMDLIDGGSSSLLTLCFLLSQCEAGLPVDRSRLEELGQQIVHGLWTELEELATIAGTVGDLGMAHGWAGFLYATLQWCRSACTPPPPELERRLEELAEQSLPVGRGLMWPWRLPLGDTRGPQFTAGWCNGSAGYVFLWTTAARVLGKDSFLELARGASWNAWESAQRDGSLCCGLVGRAYALLDLFQATREGLWLDRARDLAGIAAREGVFDSSCPEGLFQGELGLALLTADLQRPDRAWFPFLAPEPGLG